MSDDKPSNEEPKLLTALRQNKSLRDETKKTNDAALDSQEAAVAFNPWSKASTKMPGNLLSREPTIEEITANTLRATPGKLNPPNGVNEGKNPLTNLHTRPMIYNSLDEHIRWSQKNHIQSAFFLAAIDNLAAINRAFGFDIGDQITKGVGNRIAKHLRQGDQIGRYCSNKFALIIKSCGSQELPKTTSRFLRAVGDEPIQTSHGAVPITISIGAVLFPQVATTSLQAVSYAMEALDKARQNASNKYLIYDLAPAEKTRQKNNLIIADTVVRALKEGHVKLAMQPIVCCTSRKIGHHESLLVIEEEDGTLIPASEFMPVAEQLGLCRLIDYRVMELAVDLLRENSEHSLAINVSSDTTRDPEWLVSLRRKTKGNRSLLERLTIEITETTSIYDIDETVSFADALKELGCKIAVDDFGAGYSSYKNLKRINADIVKIDGEFIKNITKNHTDQLFVKSLIELAKTMNTKVVAEWVHNEEIAQFLEEAGVDYMQGYLFGKPELANNVS